MAKKAAPVKKAPKLTAAAKPRKKTEVYQIIADHTELTRKQVSGVFEALGKIMSVDLAKPSENKHKEFVVPGFMKVRSVYKPASKATQRANPFKPGEMMTVKAKPAKTVIKIRPLKALKDMV